jgi:hypothetical protein
MTEENDLKCDGCQGPDLILIAVFREDGRDVEKVYQ